MAKKFYLIKRNKIYYVRFVNPLTKTLSTAKSTRTSNKDEAEMISMTWLVKKMFPDVKQKKQVSMEERNIEQYFREAEYEKDFVERVVSILKNKGYIENGIVKGNDNDIKFSDYLYSFWDYNTSPYIKEKLISKRSIHLSHCKECQNIAKIHYKNFFKDRTLVSITLEDMKMFRNDLVDKGLSSARVNNILRTGCTALKYAFFNKQTKNNCFQGLIFCGKEKQVKKDILTLEEVKAIFNYDWKNEQSKLANKVAFLTGMRLGEIRALRKCDIGTDRIYVRHSFNPKEGLKSCKNGEDREVVLPAFLREELLNRVAKNPFDKSENAYIFFGKVPDKPIDAHTWVKRFYKVKKELGIEKPKATFHSWRHLFVTIMASNTEIKKLQQITGHKTEVMIELYSNHKREAVFKELEIQVNKNLSSVIS